MEQQEQNGEIGEMGQQFSQSDTRGKLRRVQLNRRGGGSGNGEPEGVVCGMGISWEIWRGGKE